MNTTISSSSWARWGNDVASATSAFGFRAVKTSTQFSLTLVPIRLGGYITSGLFLATNSSINVLSAKIISLCRLKNISTTSIFRSIIYQSPSIVQTQAPPSTLPPNENRAWVALITKSEYLQGALVVNHGLKNTSPPSKYPFVAMITAELPEEGRAVLTRAGIEMKEVDVLKPTEGNHYDLDNQDKRYDSTWTKLRAFEWTEYERIITLDCDMLVRKNMDHLFDLSLPGNDWIAGAQDCTCNSRQYPHYPETRTPQNCGHLPLSHPAGLAQPPIEITEDSPSGYHEVNGGLIILTPSKEVFNALVVFLRTSPLVAKFAFADQSLYANFFRGRFLPIPYTYNALKTIRLCHPTLWRDEELHNVHFVLDKPWQAPRDAPNAESAKEASTIQLNEWWWDEYEEMLAGMKADPISGWKIVDEYVAR